MTRNSAAISIIPAWNLTYWKPILVYAGLVGALLYPVVACGIPALVDYPSHIARIHILGNVAADPDLAANYRANWGVMPNLAMDALLFPFATLIPAETLGRAFIAATMLLMVGGTAFLSRSLHGRTGYWPALAGLLVYNHMLAWGFVNYLFGIGLYLVAFASWIATHDLDRWKRLAAFSAVTSLLFFAHLFALAVYGLSVAAYELGRLLWTPKAARRELLREQVFAAGQFILPAMIVLLSMPDAARHDFIYGSALTKLRAIWSPTLMYVEPIDLVVFGFLVAAIALGGGLKPPRPIRLPVIALLLAAIAMPFYMLGAWGVVVFADMRLPTVVALLIVAGLRPGALPRKTALTVAAGAAAVLIWRSDSVVERWRQVDRQYAEFRQALTVIERGASILPVQYEHTGTFGTAYWFEANYWHIASLAVLDRSAFVPHLFTDETKQPVAATPRRAIIDSSAGEPATREELRKGADRNYARLTPRPNDHGSSRYWLDWPHRFDYAVVVRFAEHGNPYPEMLRPVRNGSFFDIYRIVPATCVTLDIKEIEGTCWSEGNPPKGDNN